MTTEEQAQECSALHDTITFHINLYPELSVYQLVGMLEAIKFTLIERVPLKTIDRTPKLL